MKTNLLTIEVKDENGKVLFTTEIEVPLHGEGGLVRALSSYLDENFGTED